MNYVFGELIQLKYSEDLKQKYNNCVFVKYKRIECMQKEFQFLKGKSIVDGYIVVVIGVFFFLLRKEIRVQSRLIFVMIYCEYYLFDCVLYIVQVFGLVFMFFRMMKRMLGKFFNFIFDFGKQMFKILVLKLVLIYCYKVLMDLKRLFWV